VVMIRSTLPYSFAPSTPAYRRIFYAGRIWYEGFYTGSEIRWDLDLFSFYFVIV